MNKDTQNKISNPNIKTWKRIFNVCGLDESKIPKDNIFSVKLICELKDAIIKKWGGSRIIALKPGELTEEEREAQTYFNILKEMIQEQAPEVAKYDKTLDLYSKYDADNPITLGIALIKKYYSVIIVVVVILAFLKYLLS